MPWLTDRRQTDERTDERRTIPGDNTSAELKLKAELKRNMHICERTHQRKLDIIYRAHRIPFSVTRGEYKRGPGKWHAPLYFPVGE